MNLNELKFQANSKTSNITYRIELKSFCSESMDRKNKFRFLWHFFLPTPLQYSTLPVLNIMEFCYWFNTLSI